MNLLGFRRLILIFGAGRPTLSILWCGDASTVSIAIVLTLADLAVRILGLNLGIRVSTHEDAATMHIVVIDAHIELVNVLNGLLGLRCAL